MNSTARQRPVGSRSRGSRITLDGTLLSSWPPERVSARCVAATSSRAAGGPDRSWRAPSVPLCVGARPLRPWLREPGVTGADARQGTPVIAGREERNARVRHMREAWRSVGPTPTRRHVRTRARHLSGHHGQKLTAPPERAKSAGRPAWPKRGATPHLAQHRALRPATSNPLSAPFRRAPTMQTGLAIPIRTSSTVTTVGYGDRYPVTTEGRLIAVALILVGISLLGAITASVATWMVSQVQRDKDRAA
jgi:hypothetical protein